MSSVYAQLLGLESQGIRLGLERIRPILEALGHPERAARRTVIITGTNGKGSVAATLSAALRAQGVSAGLYSSPHLVSVLERVRLDDQDLSQDAFDALGRRVLDAIARTGTPASFFEALTALAFLAFAEQGVHTQLLEVGVGGARDATRAATPTHAVITSVGLDHAALIGPTLDDIVREKLGVVTPTSVNVASLPPRYRPALPNAWHLGVDLRVRSVGGRLEVQTPDELLTLPAPRLAGAHQERNAALAVAMGRRLGLSVASLKRGMAEVRWRARLERLPGDPPTWLDGAHNPAGVKALMSALPRVGLGPGYTLVFGAHPKKDAGPMLRTLAAPAGRVVLTQAPLLRPAHSLPARLPGRPVEVVPDPGEALARARSYGAPVLVAGSLYLAGAVLAALQGAGAPNA